ncbi:PilZ domain-containing protein [Novosphingobium flavum]|uniref:PilZ domain-containing protein n=1 Tax=Novosphingobium flavum TaxID=1778672 RepID=A0A7X1FQX8_9SPHN|nr:PilZ domain-containing protein [Novosphingobium flavum]MBC2665326.1 PilZ domain-containing protein [Novosphingobium flavum]
MRRFPSALGQAEPWHQAEVAMVTRDDREPRKRTFIEAEIRHQGGWAEVLICNISQHGMMLRGDCLPEKGSQVEIRSSAAVTSGQIRWRSGDRCGLRLGKAMDIRMMTGEIGAPGGAPFIAGKVAPQTARTKRITRLPPVLTNARRTNAGRLIELALVMLACAALGAVAINSVASILDHPLRRVSSQIESVRD